MRRCRARTIDGVLKSHGPCKSFELSKVQIGLETAELRVENETRIDTVVGGRCKHPAAMKRIIEMASKSGTSPRTDQALFIFLKFIQSIVPTINYDFTLEARLG